MSDLHPLEQLAIAGAYKHVQINLFNHDGNIFAILGTASKAMRKQGKAPQGHLDFFYKQVTSSSSYDEALDIIMDWVDVTYNCPCNEIEEACVEYDEYE